MAGLTNLILPGGGLDAAEVASNFTALRSEVNNLRDESFEPGAVNSRHFLDQAASTPNLPFKSIYRTEFGQTNISNSGSYDEITKLGGGMFPLYEEPGLVFVFAELEVYNTAVDNIPITPMGTASDSYYVKLEFAQGAGAFPGSWASFENTTTRYITPGSSVAGVPSEIGNVVVFGVAKVAASSTVFNARLTAGSFTYGGSAGTANGRCKGAISALVVSR